MIAIIGIILLIGIVKKNAIMMVDFALETDAAKGLTARRDFQAALLRFRPRLGIESGCWLACQSPAARARSR